MRKLATISAMLVTLAACSYAQDGVQWKKDFETGIKEAKTSGKLAMIDFYAEWWHWCKKLDSDTYPDKRVAQLSEQFVPIKLDAEKEGQAAAKQYDVHGYPTILFVDGDGKVVYRTAGYQPPEGFAAMMNRVLDFKHVPEWQQALKASPNDLDLLAKLGTIAAMQADEKAASDYADRAKVAIKGSNDKAKIDSYADLMNAVGDMFQNANKIDQAIPYFEGAAASGADVGKVAYALYSEGYCYLTTNKAQLALDVAKRAEALPGISKSDADIVASLKKAATQMLGKAK
jgi:thioredoxin-related protein